MKAFTIKHLMIMYIQYAFLYMAITYAALNDVSNESSFSKVSIEWFFVYFYYLLASFLPHKGPSVAA